MSEIASAALAPFTIAMSDSFFWSAESRMPITWTSLRKPSGKSGRQGRSHRRDVRISFSVGAALALEITAGEATRGVVLLTVVDGEREPVLPGLGGRRHGRGDEDVGFADGDVDGSVGQLAD
jgi:hypothetical protein